jgi:hypothetical protein
MPTNPAKPTGERPAGDRAASHLRCALDKIAVLRQRVAELDERHAREIGYLRRRIATLE